LWRLACDLLSFWRESGASKAPNEGGHARYDAWVKAVHKTEDRFGGGRNRDEITPADRLALVELAETARSEAEVAHAMAWGLSVAAGASFAPAWRDELRGSPTKLRKGAYFPVAEAPWALRRGLKLSPMSASLSAPTNGELPTIRVHDGSADVTIDSSFERSLEAVATRLTRAAAGHPNLDWGDIHIPDDSGGLVFPVRPADPARQRRRLSRLITQAQEARVPLAVLPELCITPEDVEQLAPLVESFDGHQLIVLGSYHDSAEGRRENVAVGLLAGTDRRMVQVKNAPFTDEVTPGRPNHREGIRSRTRVELTVYTADRYRFAMAICRDLLDARVRLAYDRLGVNVLLVPAMSLKTQSFRNAVAARVNGAQALTVVVNGPLNGPAGTPLRPAIIVGQPILQKSIVEHRVAAKAGLTVFRLPFVRS
jgi:predicted amidohydrolase